MRMFAAVLAVVSISVVAQTAPGQMDAPPPTPKLRTASPDSIQVPAEVLRGMAEAEPDIPAPDGASPGVVWVRVLVSTTGAVQEAIAYFGPEELRKVAADGVMGWSYRPYRLNMELWEMQSTILIDFRDGVGKRAADAGIAAGLRGVVRVSPGVAAGMAVDRPAPVYPPIAKAAHVQGSVILQAILSKEGEVEDLQVVSGPQMLVGAAMTAVRKWKYRPFLLNGKPVEVSTTIHVNFKLAEPPPDAASPGDAK